MKRKLLAAMMALLVPVILLTGCSKPTGNDKNFAYPIDESPQCLDPQIADGTATRTVIANCMEGLVRLDNEGNIQPGVAETIDVAQDGRTYTFHLRRDAKWHVFKNEKNEPEEDYFPENFNNTITAHDFVFALRRALDPVTQCPDAGKFSAIENAPEVLNGSIRPEQLGVSAPDDYTLVIRLSKSVPDFLTLLTLSAAMPCNEQFFQHTKGRYGLELSLMLYNGPFYLSKWTPDSSLIIRRNSDYTGPHAATASGISLLVDNDETNRYKKLNDGEYDASPLQAASLAQMKQHTKLTIQKNSNITWALCINTKGEALANQNMRLAFFYAIDLSQLETPDTMDGQAYGLIPDFCRIGTAPYRETAGQADLIRFDAATARSYWDNARAELKQDNVSLTLTCPSDYAPQMKKLIQNCQKVFNISVSLAIEPLEEAQFNDKLASGAYQIAFAPLKSDTSSVAEFLEMFTSNSAKNRFGYQSSIVDDLIGQVIAGGGTNVARRAESHLIQNGVAYPVYRQSSGFVLAKDVSGVYLSPVDATAVFTKAQRFD